MKISEIQRELVGLERVSLLEGERYASCLETYEAASNQREQILAWYEDKVIPELLKSAPRS